MMSTVSEKLLQVAQNNPKVYHSGQLNIVKNAECLKGSKSGSAMLIDDVSPVEHEMNVRVRGKNLFDKSTLQTGIYTKNLTQINNGFTFETNTTKATMFVACDIFLNVGTYYCSGTVSSSDGLKGGWGLYDPIKKVYIINASSRGTVNDKFTITESKTYNLSFFASYNSVADVTMTFTNIQLELGTTATAYTPYVSDLTAVKINRCGKNLLSNDTVISESATSVNKKIWSGNLPAPCVFSQDVSQFTASKPNAALFMFKLADGTEKYLAASGNIVSISGGTLKEIYFINWAEGTGTVKCQLEIGSLETDYEPYIGADYTPTADGTVEGVTSLYPNATLMTNTDGVYIDCEYYKDIDKAYNKLSAAIALSGGE